MKKPKLELGTLQITDADYSNIVENFAEVAAIPARNGVGIDFCSKYILKPKSLPVPIYGAINGNYY